MSCGEKTHKRQVSVKHLESGRELLVFDYELTDSTNLQARQYAAAGKPVLPSLFVARAQTEGRGRLGRSFYSPADTGLYMTLLFRLGSCESGLITAYAAVALADTIEGQLGLLPKIKWVNDLYLNSKKVAGILAESFESEGERLVALGVGVNITTSAFPTELCQKAGALMGAEAEATDTLRHRLAFEFCSRLLQMYELPCDEYMQKYREYSCVLGRRICFSRGGEEYSGVAEDIDGEGALLARLQNGKPCRLAVGEISVFTENGEKW